LKYPDKEDYLTIAVEKASQWAKKALSDNSIVW
jgi:hypothetical protein